MGLTAYETVFALAGMHRRSVVLSFRHDFDQPAVGMGQDQHQACMAKADQLIDEYISGIRQFQGSTNNVSDTFQAGGQKAQSILASGG